MLGLGIIVQQETVTAKPLIDSLVDWFVMGDGVVVGIQDDTQCMVKESGWGLEDGEANVTTLFFFFPCCTVQLQQVRRQRRWLHPLRCLLGA